MHRSICWIQPYRYLCLLVLLILSVLFVFLQSGASAREVGKLELKIDDANVTSDYKRVPDDRGHVMALVHRKGSGQTNFAEIVEYEAFSIIDAWVGRKGYRKGYSVLTFSDGSKIFCSWTADSKRNEDNLPSMVGKGDIAKGTGEYEGVTGKVGFTSVQNKPTIEDSSRARTTHMVLDIEPGVARAEETKSVNVTITHEGVKRFILPAGDVAGHVVGMGVREGKAVCDDGATAKFENVYTMDIWRGRKNVVWSNVKMTFEDGSWIFIKNTTISTPNDNGKLVGKGKGEIVKGTGRFEGITGTFETIAGKAEPGDDLPQGARVVDALLTYTLP